MPVWHVNTSYNRLLGKPASTNPRVQQGAESTVEKWNDIHFKQQQAGLFGIDFQNHSL